MRPARLAIAVVAAALAAGLVQAPALAETPAPATPAAGNVVLDEETGEPIDTTQPPVDPAVPAPSELSVELGADSATITGSGAACQSKAAAPAWTASTTTVRPTRCAHVSSTGGCHNWR